MRALSSLVLGPAEGNDLETVPKVATNAFGMDAGWSDNPESLRRDHCKGMGAGISKDPPDCVILRPGCRIIAASVVNSGGGVENQLATVPCGLHEYRGRGIGTVLLEASLGALRNAGLRNA